MFFVATAPNAGLINVSPKGYDSVRITDGNTIQFLDLTGSGAETIAHVTENGRITFMWCGFEEKPNIVRAYGNATVHLLGSDGFAERRSCFGPTHGDRSIIETRVTRVSSSCGLSIPFYDYAGEREKLTEWAIRKGTEGVLDYQLEKNQTSIDGLSTGIG